MNNNNPGTHDCLDGVLCDVVNCVYNKDTHQCHAHAIKVGPQYATSCNDTVCDTFKKDV